MKIIKGTPKKQGISGVTGKVKSQGKVQGLVNIAGKSYANPIEYIGRNRKMDTTTVVKDIMKGFGLSREDAILKVREWENDMAKIGRLSEGGNFIGAAELAYRLHSPASVGHIYIDALQARSGERQKVFDFIKKNGLYLTQPAAQKLRALSEKVYSEAVKEEIKHLLESSRKAWGR